MRLVSRDVVFDLDTITKTNVGPDDVVIIRVDNPSAAQSESIKNGFMKVFPNNKVVVLDSKIGITIASITP